MATEAGRFFAPQAWIAGAWASECSSAVDAAVLWSGIHTDAPAAQRDGADALDGSGAARGWSTPTAMLSSARSSASRSARRPGAAGDDFWSWRDRMYSVALRITPPAESIATQLYAELLAGGYTQVCEFHYLHNASGRPALRGPAGDVAGAGARGAAGGNRPDAAAHAVHALRVRGAACATTSAASRPARSASARLVEGAAAGARAAAQVNAGRGDSLPARRRPGSQRRDGRLCARSGLPVHIHIAEQIQEVRDCMSHTGRRPIEWLLERIPVDSRWNLVHATQAEPAELRAVRASGAAIVLCPSTEANLGDGVFDYADYAGGGGKWSVGSDSHVTRGWAEELRLLEYSQRLVQRKRNVAAQAAQRQSSAQALFESALAGGETATLRPVGGIAVGRRADFLVLDTEAPALLGMPADHRLDALVFSSPQAKFKAVYVAGNRTLGGADPANVQAGVRTAIAQDFARTMTELWGA